MMWAGPGSRVVVGELGDVGRRGLVLGLRDGAVGSGPGSGLVDRESELHAFDGSGLRILTGLTDDLLFGLLDAPTEWK